MSALNPQLAELDRQFAAALTDASSLVDGLSSAQFNWRPEPRNWSMSQCLLHLNMIGDNCVRLVEQTAAEAWRQGRTGAGPFGYGLVGNWILANTEPPPKRNFKAPRQFQPVEDQPVRAVLPTFIHLQGRLCRVLEQVNGLDLARVRVPAPGLLAVRLNLFLTLTWIASHQRRHLWQARQVRGHALFPQALAAAAR